VTTTKSAVEVKTPGDDDGPSTPGGMYPLFMAFDDLKMDPEEQLRILSGDALPQK
jgi:hypothetical protein